MQGPVCQRRFAATFTPLSEPLAHGFVARRELTPLVPHMNLKSLTPKVRALVEGLTEPATEEGYEVVDVEEDGDTVTVTFSRDVGFDQGDGDEEEDDS